MTSKQPNTQRCENKMTGDVITLSKDEYERLAAYRKRVIPYMCPDEAKDWQVFFDLVETRTHSAAPERLCDECNIIEVEERLINAEQDLKGAKEQAKREERERVLEWAKKHHWPTTGGHRVIGFDKLKEFLEPLRGGATEQGVGADETRK